MMQRRVPPQRTAICYRCGQPGHIVPTCSTKSGKTVEQPDPTERRVDICTVSPASGDHYNLVAVTFIISMTIQGTSSEEKCLNPIDPVCHKQALFLRSSNDPRPREIEFKQVLRSKGGKRSRRKKAKRNKENEEYVKIHEGFKDKTFIPFIILNTDAQILNDILNQEIENENQPGKRRQRRRQRPLVAIMIIPTSMQSTFSKEICQYPKDPACRNRQALFLRVLDEPFKEDTEYIQALRSSRNRHGRQRKRNSRDDIDLNENRPHKKKRLFMPLLIIQMMTSGMDLVSSIVDKVNTYG
ncbi:unnamed protein product [Danaus chrysippus]|uniref:(African queen) hypothetical protein n=1 Tax=Danaus chrysippus TaxID=151541 RepID=A0A8J2QXW6_9NEOP|nr:unnamed protein product [Danaus chrysippus]